MLLAIPLALLGAVGLYRQGAGQPSVGTYALAPVDPRDGASRGFTIQYFRVAGDTAESYAAATGHVEITHSDEDRIEGTFRALSTATQPARCAAGPVGFATVPRARWTRTPRTQT